MLPFCVLVKLQHRSAASPRPASSRRNLCSLSDSALDCSFSFVFPNFQLSTFDFQPPLFPKSFTCHISENGPVSPLVATLKDRPASVANKRLTAKLSPLSATLTKNRGECSPLDVPPLDAIVNPYLLTSLLYLFTPPVPLQPNAFGATIRKGTRILYFPGKQLRSPRCLTLESGHREPFDNVPGRRPRLGRGCKSCLDPAF
jgi:hypothetical protein